MHIDTLATLRPTLRAALARAGFASTDALAAPGLSPLDLAARCGVSPADAAAAIEAAGAAAAAPGTSALDLLAAEEARARVPTFCQALDELLGGGVPCGAVTEVAGLPGVGKTQLAMQLCVTARLPAVFGGADGGALYVDTEGSFVAARFREIAAAAVAHVQLVVNAQGGGGAELQAAAEGFTVRRVLEGCHHIRAYDAADMAAIAVALPALIAQHRARIVVVDSAAFPYRGAPTVAAALRGGGDRGRAVLALARALHDVAAATGAAVVATNQMTTQRSGDVERHVPALGDSWGHAMGARLLLAAPPIAAAAHAGERVAQLTKADALRGGSARLRVCREGIRDSSYESPGAPLPPGEAASSGLF